MWPAELPWVRQRAAACAADAGLIAWLALGEAGEQGPARLEARAANAFDLRDDPEAAAGGAEQGALDPQGPAEVEAAFPCAALTEHLRSRGHRLGDPSRDAGRHCCNALLYLATRVASGRRPAPPIGFLHLPRRREEVPRLAALVRDALAWLGPRT